VFWHILPDLLDTILIDFPIALIVINQCGQAAFPFQQADLVMQYFYLFDNELADIECLLPIVYLLFFVFIDGLVDKFLFVGFEQQIDLLEDI
jgi:hypothetical protein